MKHKIITLCLITLCLNSIKSSAQETTSSHPFEKGTNVLSVGLGIGGSFGSYNYSSQTPGISLQYEHGNWDVGGPGVISLGGYVGIKSYTYKGVGYNYTWTYKWNYTVIGLRSAYHYNGITSDKADIYGGVMLSYNILNFKYSSSDPAYDYLNNNVSYGSRVGFTLYVGGRYFFSERVAGFAELGYGVSYLTLGAAFKL
jgi:hypothetical protein